MDSLYIEENACFLSGVFAGLNQRFFRGTLKAEIFWSDIEKLPGGLVLAKCAVEQRRIRISRLLLREQIPSWYLSYVVFHEMLHLKLGYNHTRLFRREESRFPFYKDAMVFEEKEIHRILG